jgi:glycosyltransferase involved in cell wall biosynthesis
MEKNNNTLYICTIVIPVYKSVDSLSEISENVERTNFNSDQNFEIIFINDSPNFFETNNILRDLEEKYSFVKVISLRKNQGQHVALIVGMAHAQGKYVITMDDDLQHPVEELPNLVNAMEEDSNTDAIFAVPPYTKRKSSFWRSAGSYILSKIDNYFLEKPKGIVKSSFRIMKKELSDCIVNNFNAMPSVSSLIIKHTHNIKNIEVKHHKRKYGRSNYTFTKLISLTLNNLINFSSLPLKVVGFIGFFSFIFAFMFVAVIIFRYFLMGIDYPGYTSIIALTGLLGGLNLLSVGIIGEYLIRILRDLQKPVLKDLIKD